MRAFDPAPLFVTLLLWLGLAASPAASQPFPITPLVTEGDNVPGVGSVTAINNLAVNDLGEWIVEAETDYPNLDFNTVLIKNGSLLLREGGTIMPVGAALEGFDSLSLTVNSESGWNFYLTGPPVGQDSGLYFNQTLVIQAGDASTAPEFSPETPYLGFFDVKFNDLNRMSVLASLDDGAIPTAIDQAFVLVQLDIVGHLLSESVVAREGDLLQGQTETVAGFGPGGEQSGFNNSGQVLFFADLAGPTDADGAIYLDNTLVAQESGPSPIPGRSYELLSSRGMNLNDLGDVVHKANLDGAPSDDELIVRNGAVFAREGDDLPVAGGFGLTGFGIGSGPVQIDDLRNVLWFAQWDNPNTDEDSGLLLNRLLLVHEGVTLIDGLPVDTVFSGADGFRISNNGRHAVFKATLQGGIEGAFVIDITPEQPVPDGNVVGGTQATSSLASNGEDIDITWDASSCPADDYNLFIGRLDSVATLTYTETRCGLGHSGHATFTPPSGDLFWVVASVDDTNLEGAHGFDSSGGPRQAAARGACGVVAQVNGSTCSP